MHHFHRLNGRKNGLYACVYMGVFGDGPANAANRILPWTLPGCDGNEIWDKMGYNSACVRDICEIFAFIGGFSGMGH